MSAVLVRKALAEDIDLLWEFLAIAACEPNGEAARSVPVVAAHLAGWKRPGDLGVIAKRDGVSLGASWARQYTIDEQPVYFAGPRLPEISIGVLPGARGAGIGLALLRQLESLARAKGLHGLCLNVRETNPAIRLYERAGYRIVHGSEVDNRMGGLSLGMVLRF